MSNCASVRSGLTLDRCTSTFMGLYKKNSVGVFLEGGYKDDPKMKIAVAMPTAGAGAHVMGDTWPLTFPAPGKACLHRYLTPWT